MQNHEQIIDTPQLEVLSNIGRVQCDWSNACLMRFYDPYDNYLEYNDGEQLHRLNILDDDWERLAELHFPWEYWPDLSMADGEPITLAVQGEEYELRPHNTKLRLFEDSAYNHIEHQVDPQHLRGIKVVPAVWRLMFKGDYPVKYLPYLDRASKEWWDNIK